jgi:hypothetical protein
MARARIFITGIALSLAAALAMSSCSSSGSTGDPGAGGAGAAPVGGAGGGPTTGQGGDTTTGAGGSAASNVCAPDPQPDMNCNTTYAKMGATCTKDCCVQCGFNGLGTKICTCDGGLYTMCPCPKPTTYLGAATAPYCDTPDGTTPTLKNTECTVEWQECVGKDLVSGTTPQGCVCMQNPSTGTLQWYCGSTNKWFSLTPGM